MIEAIEIVSGEMKRYKRLDASKFVDNSPVLISAIEQVISAHRGFRLELKASIENETEVISAIDAIALKVQTAFPSPNKPIFLKMLNRQRDENLHSDYINVILRLHPQALALLNVPGDFLRCQREARLDYLNSYLKGSYLGARRIDLLIETTKAYLIIENKLESQELNSQTSDYYSVIKGITDKQVIGIMLSPTGMNAGCEHYRKMSYYQLFLILSQVENRSDILEYYLSELFDIFIRPFNKRG